MAFNEENLSVIGGESSSGPSIYAYNAAGDDVSVDMYFDSKYDTFRVDDIIHVSDTDSYAIFRVTASGSKDTGVDVQAYVSSATGSGQVYVGGGSVGNTKYSSVNTFASGTSVIDESYLGSYNRLAMTNDLTIQIKDAAANWQTGDILDFWCVSQAGYPGTTYSLIFEGENSTADFNEGGNTGAADFVATQTISNLVRLVYVGSNTWDVWELYI